MRRRWRRVVVGGVALAAGWIVVGAAPARACSCGRTPDDEPGARLRRAPGAFIGTAESTSGETTTFRVERAIKGGMGASIRVRRSTGDPDCAPIPEPGSRVALFVDRRDGEWLYGACAGADPDALVLASVDLARTGPTASTATLVSETVAALALIAVGRRLVRHADATRPGVAEAAGS